MVSPFGFITCRGVTVLAASGDDGVANFLARDTPGLCGYDPSFPASSPYVLAVGGTEGLESGSEEVFVNMSTILLVICSLLFFTTLLRFPGIRRLQHFRNSEWGRIF